jgi:hypothetical protein
VRDAQSEQSAEGIVDVFPTSVSIRAIICSESGKQYPPSVYTGPQSLEVGHREHEEGSSCSAVQVCSCGSPREEKARDINETEENLLVSAVELSQHEDDEHKRHVLSEVDLGAGADVERVKCSLRQVSSVAHIPVNDFSFAYNCDSDANGMI